MRIAIGNGLWEIHSLRLDKSAVLVQGHLEKCGGHD